MASDATGGMVNRGIVTTPEKAVSTAMMVFLALQCLDLLTTVAAFSHGGMELNPVVSSLMRWTGRVPAVLLSKVALVSLILLLNRRARILRFANILYTVVVAWNLAIVFALV